MARVAGELAANAGGLARSLDAAQVLDAVTAASVTSAATDRVGMQASTAAAARSENCGAKLRIDWFIADPPSLDIQ